MAEIMSSFSAAEILGTTPAAVEGMLRSGQLRSITQHGRDWVDSASVRDLVTKPDGKPGLGEVARSLLLAATTSEIPPDVRRTLDGLAADRGGYLVGPEFASEMFTRVRSYEPLARLKLYTTTSRQFEVPTTAESSRARGARFGGAIARVGQGNGGGEDLSSALTLAPTVAPIRFNCKDVVTFIKCSEDLLADGPLVAEYLADVQSSESAFELVNLLIGGFWGYAGLINWTATIASTRAVANAIALADVDKMWTRLYGPCRRNAVWMCNDDTMLAIDQMAVTEAWNTSIYAPQGVGGNKYALLKGRPLLPVEQCSALGSLGDLILFDPSQVGLCVHVPRRPSVLDPGLTLAAVGADEAEAILASGMERRVSHHRYWDTDQAALMSKFRADIQPMWSSSVTPLNATSAASTLSAYVCLAK